MKRISALIFLAVFTLTMVSCNTSLFNSEKDYTYSWENITAKDQARFDAVKTFADNIIKNAKDPYKGKKGGKTPLFANGINIETGELAIWRNWEGTGDRAYAEMDTNKEFVFSNFATQQNFMRTLDGLTQITNNPSYKKSALDAAKYMLKNKVSKNGLIYWGGHSFIDLKSGMPTNPSGEFMQHELKFAYPYYELLYEANPAATSQFFESMWDAHVKNWNRFEISRHGLYKSSAADYPWDNEKKDFPVRVATRALSFINGGSDIMLTGFMKYILDGDKKAYDWAKLLMGMYIKAKNPDTGLMVYQYNYYMMASGSEGYEGDRAYMQMGQEFGPSVTEVDMTGPNFTPIYGDNPLMLLYVYDKLPQKDAEILSWCEDGLVAFQKNAYDYETKLISPILADGTDMTGYTTKRDGYYGKAGDRTFAKMRPNSTLFLSSLRTALRSNNETIWKFGRSIGEALGVGDIGESAGKNVKIDLNTQSVSNEMIFALCELYNETGVKQYLDCARKIGDNIMAKRYVKGYFVDDEGVYMARIDSIDALALLKLHATIIGVYDSVPEYYGGHGYLEGGYLGDDGKKYESLRETDYYKLFKK